MRFVGAIPPCPPAFLLQGVFVISWRPEDRPYKSRHETRLTPSGRSRYIGVLQGTSGKRNEMRLVVAICSVLLLLSACKRGAQTTTGPSGIGAASSSSSSVGEARALLEKGKQLYREDQDDAAAEA